MLISPITAAGCGEQKLRAIDSPFSVDNSIAAVIVNSKGRALGDESLVPFIQTDTAVSPGDSVARLVLRMEVWWHIAAQVATGESCAIRGSIIWP